VPVTDEERVAWLNDWWERIDQWIDDHRQVDRVPDAP
jgi:hypothetical protein